MRTSNVLLIPCLATAVACGGAAPPAPPAPPAPASPVEAAAATITAEDVARHIGALAHDSARGRDTPSPELEKAAAYIAAQFRDMGLEPGGQDGTYHERWTYDLVTLGDDTRIAVQGQGYTPRYGADFFLVPGQQPATEAPAFYAGEAGAATQLPPEAAGRVLFFELPVAEVGMEWQQRLLGAVQAAMMNGAAGIVLILHPDFPADVVPQLADATATQQAPIPVAGLTADAATRLIAAAGGDLGALREAAAPAELGATLEIAGAPSEQRFTPPNVIGVLPGSDPALRDTYIVFTAHFDHDGVKAPDASGDSIYNGADDNASGTTAIMEIAEAFAALPQAPARTLVFLAVSGEEKGLLGAQAWVDDPTVDLEGVVANINLDMVGRNAPDTVIGIGQEYSSLEGVLREITTARPELGLNVILDPAPEEMYFFRSDQLPFIKAGIPAVFFTTSDHEDYHRPSDEAHKIDNDKVARVARLGFYLGHAIASDPAAPEWTTEGWQKVEQILEGSPF